MRGGHPPMGPMGPQGPQEGRRRPHGPYGAPRAPKFDEFSLFWRGAPKSESGPRILGRKKNRDMANLDPPRAPGDLPRHFVKRHGVKNSTHLMIYEGLKFSRKKMGQNVPGSQCRPEPGPGGACTGRWHGRGEGMDGERAWTGRGHGRGLGTWTGTNNSGVWLGRSSQGRFPP